VLRERLIYAKGQRAALELLLKHNDPPLGEQGKAAVRDHLARCEAMVSDLEIAFAVELARKEQ
jgi:hypothetical protein